ncbi:YcaO-like family protein [Kitasatospora sp. NBC_01266]|uniref:YcaO-like family protein n=1 Tax=Kitasatospora sp. NBC_01266 TaxID=2903572 RepID=UPI002E376304|nr:YcaO-like family protein [Kitasatospora sp. NBC_01266]
MSGPLENEAFPYRLAPWVAIAAQGADVLLLGPDLALVRVEADTEHRTPALVARAVADCLGADRAVAAGFLDQAEPRDEPPSPADENRGDEPVAGIIVCRDTSTADACTHLIRHLRAEGAGRWVLARDGELPAPDGRAPFVIDAAQLAAARLPDNPSAHPGYRLLRIGEAFEGSYVAAADDRGSDSGSVDAHWAFEERLASLGFTDRPVPIVHRIRTDPAALARAIRTAASLPPGGAVLAATGRTVAFATPGSVGSTPFRELPDRQGWTFGMVRGLVVRPGSIAGSQVATCRTPAGGQDHLEGNSGKGITPSAAITGAVGEAVERYAAYQANWSLPPARQASRRVELADLHPYGAAWERQCEGAPGPVAYVDGVSLVDGAGVAVPKALVTFPCPSADRPTDGTTTGLAAAPDADTAVLRGLREVLERQQLYTSFSALLPARRLDHTGALRRLGLDGAFPGRLWAVHWPHEGYALPDVHAFHHDPQAGLLVRASGSGVSFEEALDGAVTELCQVHFEAVRARRTGEATSAVHAAWARRPVIDRARRYLDAQPWGSREALPYSDERGQLAHLVDALAVLGTDPIVVRLPLRGPDWTVVRVLVPGATTSPHASRSRGGRPLLDAPWAHGIPT